MPHKNKEEVKEYKRKYYIKNKEEINKKQGVYRCNNREKIRVQENDHYKKFSGKIRKYSRGQGYKYRTRLKLECLTHYSLFDFPKCSYPGCEVADVDMLVLDHVMDNGSKHREEVKATHGKSSTSFFVFLIKSNFPLGI